MENNKQKCDVFVDIFQMQEGDDDQPIHHRRPKLILYHRLSHIDYLLTRVKVSLWFCSLCYVFLL